MATKLDEPAKYRGLVVGGPLDGRMMESLTKTFQSEWTSGLGDGAADEINEHKRIHKVTYVHRTMNYRQGKLPVVTFDFWAPSRYDETFIMRQLMTAYERKHTKEGTK